MRIFLSSPRDVANYREAALRVAERLNQKYGAKLGSSRFVDVVDWSAHIASLQDLPEQAILEELSLEDWDVFLGIAWLAFDGVPPSGMPAPSTNGQGSSTERNFEIAFHLWKERSPSQCFLCRCMRLPEKLTDIDGRSLDRVHRFFSRFSLEGLNPVRYYEFDSTTDLEEHLAGRLATLIDQLDEPSSTGASPAAESGPLEPRPLETQPAESQPMQSQPAEAQLAETQSAQSQQVESPRAGDSAQVAGSEFERKMEPGKAYEVSFLSIEVVRSDQVLEAEKTRANETEKLYSSFRELVRHTASAYGGEIFSWNRNGGVVIFWRNRSFDHAIMTGLKVLHNLPVFNLDTELNPLGFSIRTSSAAHDAVILFQLPASSIQSPDIEFVVRLQSQGTEPGELSITRRLHDRVDNRLKPHFKYKGRIEGEPVYVCKLPAPEGVPSADDIDEKVKKLQQKTGLILDVLSTPAASLDISALDALSTAVDETYTLLSKFCTAYSRIDPEWPVEFLAEMANATAAVMSEEAETWKALRKVYVEGKFPAGKARKLEAVVQGASRRRSRPVVILDKLEKRCRSLAGENPQEKPVSLDEESSKKIDAFIRADTLDNETALTELLLHHKDPLLEFIVSSSDHERKRALLQKLWETADLALLDDLFSIRGRQRANEQKVFEVLAGPGMKDRRFQVVHQLLSLGSGASEDVLREVFGKEGIEAREADFQIAWRCVVLGHRDPEIRAQAALQLTPHSMWQAISHPSIPIHAILAIGERVNRIEGDDAKKIFFDCIRSRLDTAVESFKTKEEVSLLTRLILILLEFPFLVETGYFERFDDILRKFLERSQKAGLKVEYFESLRKTLEEARANTEEKGPSKPPAGIKKLPLTLQRRLAGESRYVYWFVSHPDPRIATETLRHVGLMNIERVLRLREVNSSVMAAVLRKPELFTRSQAIAAALNHPKCSQEFSTRYVPNMARSRQGITALQKIVNNPSANPVVRAAAKRAISGGMRVLRN